MGSPLPACYSGVTELLIFQWALVASSSVWFFRKPALALKKADSYFWWMIYMKPVPYFTATGEETIFLALVNEPLSASGSKMLQCTVYTLIKEKWVQKENREGYIVPHATIRGSRDTSQKLTGDLRACQWPLVGRKRESWISIPIEHSHPHLKQSTKDKIG